MTIKITPKTAGFFNLKRHHLSVQVNREHAIDVIDDILGLNAQGAMNYQLSLWNRIKDLNHEFLIKALYKEKSLVRSWFMRNTVHIIPAHRFRLFRQSLKNSSMREWNRWTIKTGVKKSSTSWNHQYGQVLDLLDDGPLTVNQLLNSLGRSGEDAKRDTHRLVREMSLQGLLCHSLSFGPWYHNTEQSFARVDRWLPKADSMVVSETKALSKLFQRYLEAYGPASLYDFAYWTGIRIKEAKTVFQRSVDYLAEVTIKGQKRKAFLLKDDVSNIQEISGFPSYVRLLPKFDALIMGHQDKSRFIDPSYKKDIFLPRAEVEATILIEGQVEGVWKIRKRKKAWQITLTPFRKFTDDEMDKVEEEIDRLRVFSGFEIEIDWIKLR